MFFEKPQTELLSCVSELCSPELLETYLKQVTGLFGSRVVITQIKKEIQRSLKL